MSHKRGEQGNEPQQEVVLSSMPGIVGVGEWLAHQHMALALATVCSWYQWLFIHRLAQPQMENNFLNCSVLNMVILSTLSLGVDNRVKKTIYIVFVLR